MNNRSIQIMKDLIPPVIFSLRKKMFSKYLFSGDYANWKEAEKYCTGYDTSEILNIVKDALLKVKNGQAVFERDSIIFDKIQHSFPLLTGLLMAALENSKKLSVLDFGGSLGSSYYQNSGFLRELDELKWSIVEQKHFVECGIKYFEEDNLRFYYNITECIEHSKPDFILFSSVLQYLENPYEILRQAQTARFEYIFIDRTYVFNDVDRIVVQKVPKNIYPASYPMWVFNENKLLEFFKGSYELIMEFDAIDGTTQLKDTDAFSKGYFLKKIS